MLITRNRREYDPEKCHWCESVMPLGVQIFCLGGKWVCHSCGSKRIVKIDAEKGRDATKERTKKAGHAANGRRIKDNHTH